MDSAKNPMKIPINNFQLFDFSGTRWRNLSTKLADKEFETLEEFYDFVNSIYEEPSEFETLKQLVDKFKGRLLKLVNFVREISVSLPEYFPTGEIPRLSNPHSRVLRFSRRQVLVLLAHMFLCTLTPTLHNNYWVTFHNWLSDGRGCAMAYLECLLRYFEQSMEMECQHDDFWNEMITFERHRIDPSTLPGRILAHSSTPLTIPTIDSVGKIGNSSVIEIDFANKDIGFGTYGTQEEILFGGRPEMCIAMLFCDSMTDDECILIRGTNKVGDFNGYGSSIELSSILDPVDPSRNERVVIAIDAIDFSSCEDPLSIQFEKDKMLRELGKLVVGFSSVPPGSVIDTGNWGCGAFCGNKRLKATIQLIAATIANVQLNFFPFGDAEFATEFEKFCKFVSENDITVETVWDSLNQCDNLLTQTNVFLGIMLTANQ